MRNSIGTCHIMQLLNEKGIPLKEAKIPAIVIERTTENEKIK